jgi:alpha-galactosidase
MSQPGPTPFERFALIRYDLEGNEERMRLTKPNRTSVSGGLQFTWRWQDTDEGGYRIWVRVTHRGDEPIRLKTIDVVHAPIPDLGTSPDRWSVYQHGWGSWTPVLGRHFDQSLYTEPGHAVYQRTHQPHLDTEISGAISSEWVTVIASRGQPEGATNALMVGFVTTANQLGELLITPDGTKLIARCHLDGTVLVPGESVRSEVLLLHAGTDPLGLLDLWAEQVGENMKARVPDREDIPTGWCSWYTFYGENTADDVLQNVEAIDHNQLPLDVILIDDGYQTAIGDWFSFDHEKFPDGMIPVAEAIRDAGHRLGVWTAPFGATIDSQLFADHPDWFLHDEASEPVVGWTHWGTDCYALDTTHPEVLDWLEEAFRRMRKEWKADFFKIDFLFAAARPGQRRDDTATRAQALRRGLKAIRKGIGRSAFLLGCGAPMGPSIGIVDGMRVGPDVDPNWRPLWKHDLSAPSTENALRNAITRAPFHGRLWANDPDCLLVRDRGEDMDLVLNEMRTLSALVALLGGLTFDSDNLVEIRLGRLKYLRQTLPPTGRSARPLDLFQNEMPRRLLLPVERDWGRWWIAGLINWDDKTTETTVPLADLGLPRGRYHVYHYWRRRYLGIADKTVTIHRHQPHETAVLLFKPMSEWPDLLTTTFHVCQGAVEVADYRFQLADSTAHLTVVLEKEGVQFGDVLFTVPRDWRVAEAQVDGVQREPRVEAPRVVALGLTLEGRSTVEMVFNRI